MRRLILTAGIRINAALERQVIREQLHRLHQHERRKPFFHCWSFHHMFGGDVVIRTRHCDGDSQRFHFSGRAKHGSGALVRRATREQRYQNRARINF